MIVYCNAKECQSYKNGTCTRENIVIRDMEEKENIKFKDVDFMVCINFKWKED